MTEREWCETIWPVLTSVAQSGGTITYADLKGRIGFKGWQRTFSSCLGRIANFCYLHELPILTAVVVSKVSGKPGSGIPYAEDFHSELARVGAHPWQRQTPPVAEAFPESACRAAAVKATHT